MAAASPPPETGRIIAVAPNLKRRLSGVTATTAQVVPHQAAAGVVAAGPGLPAHVPQIALSRAIMMPRDRWRVWHARRNSEMLLGVLLRQLARRRYRLVFTSSSPRVRGAWTRWLLGRMDLVIATAAANAAVMPGAPPVVPHGIDTDRFAPAPSGAPDPSDALSDAFGPGGPLIGVFGRIRPKKGTDTAVEALCRVLPRRPGWRAVIMGRAQPQHEGFARSLRARVDEAGLAERIRFVPEMPVAEMPRAYRALSLYLAPSLLEGFGLTPLEAMGCGVPVLASRGVGAFDDMVLPGRTGDLAPPGDAEAWAAALAALTRDPARLAAMGQAARERAETRFSVQAEAEALVALYRRLLEGAP